jgi:hypothetical protein
MVDTEALMTVGSVNWLREPPVTVWASTKRALLGTICLPVEGDEKESEQYATSLAV